MPPSLSLPPSPASILFALAIFKHLLPEAEDRYQSEPCHRATHSCFKRICAEGGRVVFALPAAGLGLPI